MNLPEAILIRARSICREVLRLDQEATKGPWTADVAEPEDCVIWAGNKFAGNVGSCSVVPVNPDNAQILFDADIKNAFLIASYRGVTPDMARLVLAFIEEYQCSFWACGLQSCDGKLHCPRCTALIAFVESREGQREQPDLTKGSTPSPAPGGCEPKRSGCEPTGAKE